ncbi:uncharacterized protein LOC121815195 [Tachysurus ichikawai]
MGTSPHSVTTSVATHNAMKENVSTWCQDKCCYAHRREEGTSPQGVRTSIATYSTMKRERLHTMSATLQPAVPDHTIQPAEFFSGHHMDKTMESGKTKGGGVCLVDFKSAKLSPTQQGQPG